MIKLLVFVFLFAITSTVLEAHAYPAETACFVDVQPDVCGLTTQPFLAPIEYFDFIVPSFGLIIFWAPIVFAIWLTSKSPMITGIVGIIIAGTVSGLHPQSVQIGIMLIAISAGIAFIQIFQRIKQTV